MKKIQKIFASIRWNFLLGALAFFGLSCLCLSPSAALAETPHFEEILVADKLDDGYWVEAFDVNNDSRPDLVTSGLAVGEVAWYENPGNLTPQSQWTKHIIINLPKPVALEHRDINEDGWTDIVITHNYGDCMFDCGPEDGKISWLKNPAESDVLWTEYHIGDLVAAHRISMGRFTSNLDSEKLELLVLPIVGSPVDPITGDELPEEEKWQSPVPIVLYTRPPLVDLESVAEWPGETIDESYYHIIHSVIKGKFDANTNSNFDSLLIGSQEGLSWLYYTQDGEWKIVPLAVGDLDQIYDPDTQSNDHQFRGTGNVDIGFIGNDPYGYLATVEPFHGNKVAVYVKNTEADLTRMRWQRIELDILGFTNKNGEGAGHHLITADFDGDGDDEFLVAERGPIPFQGVYYYDPIDQDDDVRASIAFERSQVSFSSAARIALADFNGDGRLDFATTGYYTPGYFLTDDPQVAVFLNKIEPSGDLENKVKAKWRKRHK